MGMRKPKTWEGGQSNPGQLTALLQKRIHFLSVDVTWMQQQAPGCLPAPRLFSCSHIIRLANHTSLVLCLPQADRKQNKIKQGRRKENGDGGGGEA